LGVTFGWVLRRDAAHGRPNNDFRGGAILYLSDATL
jgi:hypothetical protein